MTGYHWRKLAFSLLLLGSLPALALVAEPPERLPGLGVPVPDSDIHNKLKQYCRPIAAWSRPAYDLCLEAGVSVNLAVREYHDASCSAADSRDICQQARTLYLRNFRLWDGSVDNVGRANAQLGAAGSKRVEASGELSQCKRRYREAIAVHQQTLDELQGWLMLSASAADQLSAEGLTRLGQRAGAWLDSSGFTPPVATPSCQQAMKGEHAILSRMQAEVREQLSRQQGLWLQRAAQLAVQVRCEAGREQRLRGWQQQYQQAQKASAYLQQRALLAESGYPLAVDKLGLLAGLGAVDLAAQADAEPADGNSMCSSEREAWYLDQSQWLRAQLAQLWIDQWVTDYLLDGKRRAPVRPAISALRSFLVSTTVLLVLLGLGYLGYRRMAKKAKGPASCCS